MISLLMQIQSCYGERSQRASAPAYPRYLAKPCGESHRYAGHSHNTTEDHQAQFENELQEDYGYELTENFRKELEGKFYCVIEDFYETYEHNTEI